MARRGERAGKHLGALEHCIVAGLASTRLTRAWRYEAIGQRPREFILERLANPVIKRGSQSQVNLRATARREWLAELLDCPHCLGFHLTWLCALGLRVPRLRFLIEGAAGAMLASAVIQWFPGFSFEDVEPMHIVIEDGGKEDAVG